MHPACGIGLAIGTDACSDGLKGFLRRMANASTIDATVGLSPRFRLFLGMGDRCPAKGPARKGGRGASTTTNLATTSKLARANCSSAATGLARALWRRHPRNTGIVGGLREAFEPALRSAAARMSHHHARVPRPPPVSVDMLVWNELLLDAPLVTPLAPPPSRVSGHVLSGSAAAGGGGPSVGVATVPSAELRSAPRLISGYPHGPVNLPMWGKFADRSSWCDSHLDPLQPTRKCGVEPACRLAWINMTLGHYWFAHKLQSWWTRYNAAALTRACLGGS